MSITPADTLDSFKQDHSMSIPAHWLVHIAIICVFLSILIGMGAAAQVPTISDITPETGENSTRTFTANISGSGFTSGAQVLLVPALAGPVHQGSLTDGGGTAPFLNGPQAVFLSGKNAYVVSQWSNALEIIDAGNPARPVHAGSLLNGTGGAFLAAPTGLVISGTYAYVTSSANNALEIVDVTDPVHPVHAGSITNGSGGAFLNAPRSVAVSGRYAYVTGYGSNSLEVINISVPALPVHTGTFKDDVLLKNPAGIFVSGTYAYVTSSGNNALEIVDISDPVHPVHAGILRDGGGSAPYLKSPSAVYVSGDYAYVASSGSNALEIVDVTNPAHPVHKGSLLNGIGGAWLGAPVAVNIAGHYAYVASSGNNALEIVDVSNPAVPIHLGSLIHGAGGAQLNVPSGVYVSSPNAFVTGKSGDTLEIADIGKVTSIPATGVTVRSSTIISSTFNLTSATAGEYTVFVANPSSPPGILADGFTITAPMPPRLTGITPSTGAHSTVVQITNLAGENFNTTVAPQVRLNRTGRADLAATNVTVLCSTQISCTFDLTGLEAGSWNIVVTNPDGREGVLPDGFSVLHVEPETSPTVLLITTPPEPKPLPEISGTGDSIPESRIAGRGSSYLATSPGSPAGGSLSFTFGTADRQGFTKSPYTITTVTFVPSEAVGQTDLILADAGTTARPPGYGRTTAGIISLEPVAINPSAIRSGTITFAVSDDWLHANGLTPAQVTLMRLEKDAWSELPTVYLNRSGEAHYFMATTPGFSYLAISTRITGGFESTTSAMDTTASSAEASESAVSAAPASFPIPPSLPATYASGDPTPLVSRTVPTQVKNDNQESGTLTTVIGIVIASTAIACGLYLWFRLSRRQVPPF